MSPKAFAPLLLLLTGTCATASLIPFMGVYIVEGLGKAPLHITLYALVVLPLTLLTNRHFGERIDRAKPIAPLILISLIAYVIAALSNLVLHSYLALVLIAAPCMALANGAVSSMYSYGRLMAEREGWEVARYNSYLRATTSLGWMIAPALAYSLAGAFGHRWVFALGLGFATLWFLIWLVTMPKSFAAPARDRGAQAGEEALRGPLWLAAAVCFLIALAHVTATGAIPLFVLSELGLPAATPGMMLSVKTAMEIAVILFTPVILKRLGARGALSLSGGLAMVVYGMFANAQTQVQVLILAGFEGVYYGVFAAVGLIYMQGFAGERLGGATALYMNALFLGGLIANLVMGAVAQVRGFGASLLTASGFAALALLFLAGLVLREARCQAGCR
ncbi:MFS transporter [Celeribacter neptunius]|uniref:MFS transporter, SET family, sugar efflux transporter n=1 Tax=Celeribacter neptunius TaxID=588602 RepID=A0A1I3Y5J3_9RHOB|nr:MFS transporter [Celeribacter neptunius]SFK26990.1 MFS transporter, SET family, sugar efflux transporter [Celeribacter neptunius]